MFAALLLALAQQPIPAQLTSWQEVRQAFPQRWEFPEVDANGKLLQSKAFETTIQRLVTLPLANHGASQSAPLLGDLIHTCRALQWNPEILSLLLSGWTEQLTEADANLVKSLVLCNGVSDKDWNPTKDKNDGITFGPTWKFPKDYWLEHDGSRSVEQAATLILADLSTIKQAEHDFPSYFTYPGNSYIEVAPQGGSYLRVAASADQSCSAASLSVDFCTDLPFPFRDYSVDIEVLHRKRDSEDLISYLYGQGEDIHWLAGYDRYWTIRDSNGAPVATLIVRQLAFDIDGVPEESSHRREGMRSSLGSLRRTAEARFNGEWKASETAPASVPEFEVIAPQD
ncbi:MAG: hypothetical protein GY879_08685 [Planctomycetes bacterium]|nr:hypothetical protein [Planctomycetota bacterium]MCP4861132.1 hypothetical protein [Planctomycetota bacterium]